MTCPESQVREHSPGGATRKGRRSASRSTGSNTAGMLPRLALPGRRIATLGAMRAFHHGLLDPIGGDDGADIGVVPLDDRLVAATVRRGRPGGVSRRCRWARASIRHLETSNEYRVSRVNSARRMCANSRRGTPRWEILPDPVAAGSGERDHREQSNRPGATPARFRPPAAATILMMGCVGSAPWCVTRFSFGRSGRARGSAHEHVSPCWGVEAPGWPGTTREHIGGCVTEEQRRPGGMHRQPNATVMMTGAT